jgi:hypothetical protein
MKDIAGLQRETLRERRRMSRVISRVTTATEEARKKHRLPQELEAPDQDLSDFHEGRQLKGLAYFHINSPPVVPKNGEGKSTVTVDRNKLAAMRTDLDGFGEIERAALINHGYDMADRYIRKYLLDSPYNVNMSWEPPIEPLIDMSAVEPDKQEAVIQAGRNRFFRALKLGAPISWLFLVAVTSLGIWRTWDFHVSMKEVINSVASWLLGGIGSTFWLLGTGWTELSVSLGKTIIALIVIVAVFILFKVICKVSVTGSLRSTLRSTWFKNLLTAMKFARAFGGNAVLAVSWIPAPAALATSGLAWISHIFFYLPFLRITRLKTGTR